MSRPTDLTVHGTVTGASDTLEAVRASRRLHHDYVGRHRATPGTAPEHRAPFMTKLGGLHAPRRIDDTDVIIWRREP